MGKLVFPEVIFQLHQRWKQFCAKLGAKNPEIVWEWIKSAYLSPDRYYHNFNHLQQVFQELDAIPGPHLPEVELSLWFHDIVYLTYNAQNNEEESFQIAANAIKVMELPNGYLPLLQSMILATDDHKQDLEAYNLMLDLDLSILGQPWEIFEKYQQQIRQEYVWVPLEQYRLARKEILQKFLNRPKIYKTEILFQKYENQARKNLAVAIEELK